MNIFVQILLGLVAISVLLLAFSLWRWWAFKQQMVAFYTSKYGCSIGDAKTEADCVMSTFYKKYGLWSTYQILRGKLDVDADTTKCVMDRCLRKCRVSPLSGSVVDSDIQC